MKLSALLLVIAVFSSCTDVFTFNIKNNTQSTIDIIVESSEFKLHKDTFWHEADSSYVLGKWIEVDFLRPRNRFVIFDAEKLENVSEMNNKNDWVRDDSPSFNEVQEINNSKSIRITFNLEPFENLELLKTYGSNSFRHNCISPIDTIIIKNTNPPDTFEIILNGYHAIKSMRDFPDDDIGNYTLTIN